jgi:hypothetical protein
LGAEIGSLGVAAGRESQTVIVIWAKHRLDGGSVIELLVSDGLGCWFDCQFKCRNPFMKEKTVELVSYGPSDRLKHD